MAISQIRGEQVKLGTLREYHFDPVTQIPESILDIDYHAHTETLQDKKILYKVQVNDVTADAVSSIDVSSSISGTAVTSAGSTEGILTDSPNNKVFIRDGATKDSPLSDTNGNQVYGRLTYANSAFTLSFFTEVDGTETAFTMPADQTIDFVYLKRGNLLNVPENFLVTDGGNFVEGATDIVAEFDLNQLAKDLGVTLNKDGNKSVTRSAFEEILYQTKGLVNQSVRANSIIDEVVAARNGQASLSAELEAIRTSISTEATDRANADTAIRNDLSSTDSSKGASLIGINDAGSKFTATTVEGALQELATTLNSTGSGATATTDEVETARNSDITGTHASLDARIEAGEARYELVKSEVETARNGKVSLDAELSSIRTSVSTETTNRINGDQDLQDNIDAEATARAEADTQIRNDLSATTSNNGGAKRVGVSSNAGLTGSTVEAVLVNLEGRLASQESGGGAEVTDTHTRDAATTNGLFPVASFNSLEGRLDDIESKTDAAKKSLEDADSAEATARANADTAIRNDFASTSSTKGASLVGIQDAGGLITASTVEGALQEIVTNLNTEISDRQSAVSTEQTARETADTQIINDLASTSSNKGASTVGISDAGSLYTATTVEGALQEIASNLNSEISNRSSAVSSEATARANADTAILNDYASTSNGKGASLVGIEDAGNLITATTVEGALQEVVATLNSEITNRTSADTAIRNDLASTVTAKGASLVGIEDADSQFTATTVEEALKELATAIATESANRSSANSTLSSDLASTATGKGASLVGIEDADSVFTSTTVESALKELYDAIQAEMSSRTTADTALSTRVSSLEAVRPKIHVHDRYVFTASGNEQSVTLPNSKVADANTLIFSLNGVEQAVGLHYSEVLDGNGNATGVNINPDRLSAGDIVILKWLNANQ